MKTTEVKKIIDKAVDDFCAHWNGPKEGCRDAMTLAVDRVLEAQGKEQHG